MMSARHLPPVYVDIQEEIEQNLDEIKTESKETFFILTLTLFVYSGKPDKTASKASEGIILLR